MKFNLFKSKNKQNEHMRVRIFSSMLIFTLIVLILLWVCQIVFLDDIYKGIKMSNVKTAASELSDKVSDPELNKTVQDYAAKYDTCITVWDTDFVRLASSCVNNGCRVHTYHIISAVYFYNKAEDNNGIYIQHFGNGKPSPKNNKAGEHILPDDDKFSATDFENESVMYAKIVNQNGKEYLLLMNAVITPLNAVVQSLINVFCVIAVIMIILSFIISAIISSYIVKPIKKMNSGAKQLAKGNYNVKFDENSYLEISQLASTLNYAATELSTVDSTRRELIANVSHDLRTPLTLIGGYAEMLRDFPNDDNIENLQAIIDEVNHMTMLVNDMTDVSKYDAGVHKLALSEFDLTDLVNDTAIRLSKLNNPDGINIEFKYNSHVAILGDVLKITQVLYNLINNAVTHAGDDKYILIEQKISDSGKDKIVEISITDNGKGILRENIKSIWDRYYKMDKTYKRAHNGSGLGLSIVKSILDLHHMEYGAIPVEDMPERRGCTFFFRAKITKHSTDKNKHFI